MYVCTFSLTFNHTRLHVHIYICLSVFPFFKLCLKDAPSFMQIIIWPFLFHHFLACFFVPNDIPPWVWCSLVLIGWGAVRKKCPSYSIPSFSIPYSQVNLLYHSTTSLVIILLSTFISLYHVTFLIIIQYVSFTLPSSYHLFIPYTSSLILINKSFLIHDLAPLVILFPLRFSIFLLSFYIILHCILHYSIA